MNDFQFIGKTVFFPKQEILAIGDLHIGYEHAMIQSGVLVPEVQVKEIIEDLGKVIEIIRKNGFRLKKIVFLGDLKHYFSYEWKEKFNFNLVLDFLRGFVNDSDIILIKGNHDKFDFSGKKMKNYYYNRGLMFFHGHISYPQIFENRVETLVMGHLHPSIKISDKVNIKREKYKCFLVGKYRRKNVMIVPSFLGAAEGTAVNEESYQDEDFLIVPYDYIKEFDVYVVSDDGEILNFGKVRSLVYSK